MDPLMKKWPKTVKVTHGRGRCVINIPAEWARDIGLDQAGYALISRKGVNKLEVKAFHGTEDFEEYVQKDRHGFD